MKTQKIAQEVYGYLPVVEIDCPQWAADRAAELHGDGIILAGNHDDGEFLVLDRNSNRVPGDWIIYYRYDSESGTYGHRLFAAAKIAR